MTKPSRKVFWIVSGITALLILGGVLFFVEAYRVRGFVDENTGSMKGCHAWPFGIETHKWYKESPLETFMRKEYPADLRQEWTPYQGDMRNIYGIRLGWGHGRPSLVKELCIWEPENMAPWFAHASNADKKKLYDALVAQDEAEVKRFSELIQWADHEAENRK